MSEPQQQSLIDSPCVKRAPAKGLTPLTYEASRSGSDRVTKGHTKKAAQLLTFFQRGPATMNDAAEYFGWPLSSICSLRWLIHKQLTEAGSEVVVWETGRSTVRTRWRAKR
jgi:hypothetical protein